MTEPKELEQMAQRIAELDLAAEFERTGRATSTPTTTASCARWGKPKPHGVLYAAGLSGYRCDPNNAGRDLGRDARRVFEVASVNRDLPLWPSAGADQLGAASAEYGDAAVTSVETTGIDTLDD